MGKLIQGKLMQSPDKCLRYLVSLEPANRSSTTIVSSNQGKMQPFYRSIRMVKLLYSVSSKIVCRFGVSRYT